MTYRARYRFNNLNSVALDEYRSALTKWMRRLKPKIFLTLAFNRDVHWDEAMRAFKAFNAHVDRYGLGPRWKDLEGRTDLLAFAENIESNFHLHAVGRFPSDIANMSQRNREDLVLAIWKKIVPSGTIDVQRVTDVPGVARYVTKQIHDHRKIDHFVSSREFWPYRRKKRSWKI